MLNRSLGKNRAHLLGDFDFDGFDLHGLFCGRFVSWLRRPGELLSLRLGRIEWKCSVGPGIALFIVLRTLAGIGKHRERLRYFLECLIDPCEHIVGHSGSDFVVRGMKDVDGLLIGQNHVLTGGRAFQAQGLIVSGRALDSLEEIIDLEVVRTDQLAGV